jgi:hypothetical protein
MRKDFAFAAVVAALAGADVVEVAAPIAATARAETAKPVDQVKCVLDMIPPRSCGCVHAPRRRCERRTDKPVSQ